MSSPLILPDENLVTSGVQRAVYLHPNDPTKLVKVLRPEAERPVRNNFNGIMDRTFPSTRLRQIRKEYAEYLRVMLKHTEPDFHLPFTHMFGFTATNKGLGCITERVIGTDAPLGKTLRSKTMDGTLTQDDIDLLNQTVRQIYANGIRASDMNANNFVFGHRDQAGTLGPRECVLVDGFGDTHAILVRSLSRWSNALGLDDSCKRLATKNGLQWDPKQRQFALT